jgi:hypothetical protein
MADENTNQPPSDTSPPTTEATTTTQPTTSQPSGERTFTQADVDRIVRERLARESQRRTEPARSAQQTPPVTQPTPPAPPPAQSDVRAEVARIRAFERASGRYGLSDAALSVLEQDFNAANPPDPAAWVQQRADAFGWRAGTPAPAPAASSATPPPATPTGPPVTAGGPPPNSNPVRTDTPIHKLSIPAREALRREIGDIAFKNRLYSEMANVQITGVRR